MASILRRIVAGPRIGHETGLDLCYVTDYIIATSGPSSSYPKRAYRNPTDALVRFLDSKHGEDWSIWEFRAEGTGYPDAEVYNRIHHFPWPDHHPPPFALIPPMMASMRNWINGKSNGKRVIVVHCKAGKGRSGTAACSYLISEKGWKAEDALKQFTERRMRIGFGPGVSIPSQLRYITYVDRWTNQYNKKYVERPIEIVEIHLWGLRHGVKIQVEGYVNEGRKIKCLHRFHHSERISMDSDTGNNTDGTGASTKPSSINSGKDSISEVPAEASFHSITKPEPITKTVENLAFFSKTPSPPAFSSVILRPRKPLLVSSSDVNIDFERRATAAYTGWTVVTSVAHVWFNAYFEGGHDHDSGVFEKEWDELDGIKGLASKGTRAFDKLKVVWKYAPLAGRVVSEPAPGEAVSEGHAADWRGEDVMVGIPNETDEQAASQSDEEPFSENEGGMPPRRTKTEQLQPSSPPSSLLPVRGSSSAERLRPRRQSSATAGVSFINASGNIGGETVNGKFKSGHGE